MRGFLQWADLQGSEGARVVETVLPETDDDAVRILTIHGAKGLEFPITIVSGMTTKAQVRRPVCSCCFPTTATPTRCKISARVTTEEFERYEPIDEQMDYHEKLRLLYVAMTRARDHLVVSVHRPAVEPPQRPSHVDARAADLARRRARRRRLEPSPPNVGNRRSLPALLPSPAAPAALLPWDAMGRERARRRAGPRVSRRHVWAADRRRT